jgi:hypothetical protein
MILLSRTPDESECTPCPHCRATVSVAYTGIIGTLPKLGDLLDDTLNTTTCATCGVPVSADVAI